jgi:hypothetical protein
MERIDSGAAAVTGAQPSFFGRSYGTTAKDFELAGN